MYFWSLQYAEAYQTRLEIQPEIHSVTKCLQLAGDPQTCQTGLSPASHRKGFASFVSISNKTIDFHFLLRIKYSQHLRSIISRITKTTLTFGRPSSIWQTVTVTRAPIFRECLQ
jgi:hypothetical protein